MRLCGVCGIDPQRRNYRLQNRRPRHKGLPLALPKAREQKWNGALAQLGERYNGIVEVSGSIPLGSTTPLPFGP